MYVYITYMCNVYVYSIYTCVYIAYIYIHITHMYTHTECSLLVMVGVHIQCNSFIGAAGVAEMRHKEFPCSRKVG